MNLHTVTPAPHKAPAPPRNLLSLREVVILADVPEKRVRKDIETGVLTPVVRLKDARLCFHWAYVYTIAAVYSNSLLTGRLRKIALDRMYKASFPSDHACLKEISTAWCTHNTIHNLYLDTFIKLDLDSVCDSVSPRLKTYASGLSRIEERDDILGGEAVFRNSRLPVMHIGRMIEDGEPSENILEDYRYLSEDDLVFARLYYRAHPNIGRPRSAEGAADALSPSR